MNDYIDKGDGYSPDSLRLLGLNISWKTLTEDEQRKFFKSPQRIAAFLAISTTTLPIGPKSDEKRGIVSHIIRKGLIAEDILREYPTVYLGSGDDFEYPLALGARHSILVDPILNEQQVKDNISTRLKGLADGPATFNDQMFEFMFDFGSGKELAKIQLEPRYYHASKKLVDALGPQDVYTNLPKKIGLVLLYASRSPLWQMKAQGDITSKVVEGGGILADKRFTPKGSLGMKNTIDVAKL